ncbi:MAG: hypothetical protein DCC59_00480 [Chloroflexi bacterium]|nr:MAG: hypothetical protein DCC59_00480 [Chloroflexota bacterium]
MQFVYGIIRPSFERRLAQKIHNGKDSAWTPQIAGLTRMKVLHCKMELKTPRRLKIERSAEAFRVRRDPSIFPSKVETLIAKPAGDRGVKGQGAEKTHGTGNQASVKSEASGLRLANKTGGIPSCVELSAIPVNVRLRPWCCKVCAS